MQPKQAVVLAGGKGTTFYMWRRSKPELEIPKTMLKIKGKPILEHIIGSLREGDIYDITLAVAYKKDTIKDYFQDGSKFGVKLTYLEDEGKGHVKALKGVEPYVSNLFVVCYGDHVFSPELGAKLKNHEQKGISVTYYRPSHMWPNAIMKTDAKDRITEIGSWMLGVCGPFREYEGVHETHKGFLKFGNPVSKTLHVFSEEIFDIADWNQEFISGILHYLAKRKLAYAVQHSATEVHAHHLDSYIAALKMIDPKSFDEIKNGKEFPDLARAIEQNLRKEFRGIGRYSWEATPREIRKYEKKRKRLVAARREEFRKMDFV